MYQNSSRLRHRASIYWILSLEIHLLDVYVLAYALSLHSLGIDILVVSTYVASRIASAYIVRLGSSESSCRTVYTVCIALSIPAYIVSMITIARALDMSYTCSSLLFIGFILFAQSIEAKFALIRQKMVFSVLILVPIAMASTYLYRTKPIPIIEELDPLYLSVILLLLSICSDATKRLCYGYTPNLYPSLLLDLGISIVLAQLIAFNSLIYVPLSAMTIAMISAFPETLRDIGRIDKVLLYGYRTLAIALTIALISSVLSIAIPRSIEVITLCCTVYGAVYTILCLVYRSIRSRFP